LELLNKPKVTLIGLTRFFPPEDIEWETDTESDSLKIIEFAGRACYQSFHNPAKRTNAQYIGNMLDHGHLSVIEHAVASFYVTGISRSLTHELIRHRHFSYSQVSQRYVSEENSNMIEPEVIAEDPELHARFVRAVEQSQQAYNDLYASLQKKHEHVEDKTLRRKMSRQAARSVMPNATETKMVLTGNFRAFRHFFRMRATEHADVEIRAMAVDLLKILQREAPAVFGDYVIESLPDGSEIANTRFTYD
jgi:thymidylate synthase (FAD)